MRLRAYLALWMGNVYTTQRYTNRDTYTFLQEAYTHVLMRGEAFDLSDGGDATEELFALE